MTALVTERDVVSTLSGTLTLEDLYEAVEAAAEVGRDGGQDVVHGVGDRRWKRRVRCALQDLRVKGQAERVGRGTWVLSPGSTVEQPKRMLLVVSGQDLDEFELAVCDAAELLEELADDDVRVDLVVTDPPWALKRGAAQSMYGNGDDRLLQTVPGYVDVDPDRYPEFTRRWVGAAAELLHLRPGGYLVVVTGPQQAARVQVEAEDAGLTYVNQIVASRTFAVRTTRRFAHGHYVATVLCSGPLDSAERTFNPPSDQRARSGREYPIDFWPATDRPDRRGLLRYDNTLPVGFCRRLIEPFTNAGDLVVDPFLGGGGLAVAAHDTRRRYIGADVNPHAVRYVAARMLAEHVWPAAQRPTLFQELPA